MVIVKTSRLQPSSGPEPCNRDLVLTAMLVIVASR